MKWLPWKSNITEGYAGIVYGWSVPIVPIFIVYGIKSIKEGTTESSIMI